MSNERAKFEEWAASRFSASAMIKDAFGYYFASVTVQAAWHAWQASRVAALADFDIEVLVQAANYLNQLGGGPMEDRLRLLYDQLAEIRSLAEAPTKEE